MVKIIFSSFLHQFKIFAIILDFTDCSVDGFRADLASNVCNIPLISVIFLTEQVSKIFQTLLRAGQEKTFPQIETVMINLPRELVYWWFYSRNAVMNLKSLDTTKEELGWVYERLPLSPRLRPGLWGRLLLTHPCSAGRVVPSSLHYCLLIFNLVTTLSDLVNLKRITVEHCVSSFIFLITWYMQSLVFYCYTHLCGIIRYKPAHNNLSEFDLISSMIFTLFCMVRLQR